MAHEAPWWASERHGLRRHRLEARGRIAAGARRYFEQRGFIETACSSLVRSPGNEAHLHAARVELGSLDGGVTHGFLHTSPEFAMKKLLAAGERRIFELARVFRGRESGPLNAPEFTMLEWYRADEPYEAVIEDALALVGIAASAAGTGRLSYRGREVDPSAPPRRISLAEAFGRFADVDLLASVGAGGEGDRAALAAAAKASGVAVSESDSWSDIFSRLLQERVEPNLQDGIVILDEYPRPEAALARTSARDSRVAERFEIYVCGVELANGFGELTDADEQRRRFELEMDEKERVYGERYPIDEEFLAAIGKMPPASGVALGFERLVMLATGASDIGEVMWTPPQFSRHGSTSSP